MEQLIVRLGTDASSSVSWLVWSTTESEVIASGVLPDAQALDTLSERAGQRPIIALVPSSDVVLKWVTLPPRAGRKVIAAIPFMLEDELSEDIADLFFAMGPKRGDEQAVAVVRHDKMQTWQTQLQDAGLNCDRVIPDVLAVPVNEQGLSLLTLAEQVLVREDEWQGFQGESDWIVPALAHLTKRQSEPMQLNNYSDLDLGLLPNAHVDAQTLELPMAVLAKEAMAIKFNLFQGDYKTKKKTHSAWKQWRLAASLAVLALLVGLIDKSLTLQQLSSQNEDLKAQINQQVKSGFPNMGSYRDLRRKVTSEMAKLEQGGGSASMLVMLSQLSPAFSASQLKPQSIRFDGARQEIRLQALAANFESLERFKRQAEEAGFTVEQGAINNLEEGVVGSLAIRSNV